MAVAKPNPGQGRRLEGGFIENAKLEGTAWHCPAGGNGCFLEAQLP